MFNNKFPQEGILLVIPTKLQVVFPSYLAVYDLAGKLDLLLSSEQHIHSKSATVFEIIPKEKGKLLDEQFISAVQNLNNKLVADHAELVGSQTAPTDSNLSVKGYINSDANILITEFLTKLEKKITDIGEFLPLNLVGGQYLVTLKQPENYQQLQPLLTELAAELKISAQEIKGKVADGHTPNTLLYKNNMHPDDLLTTVMKQVATSVAAVAAGQVARRLLHSFNTNALIKNTNLRSSSTDKASTDTISITDVLEPSVIQEQLSPDLSAIENVAQAQQAQQSAQEKLANITEENNDLGADIWEVINNIQDIMSLKHWLGLLAAFIALLKMKEQKDKIDAPNLANDNNQYRQGSTTFSKQSVNAAGFNSIRGISPTTSADVTVGSTNKTIENRAEDTPLGSGGTVPRHSQYNSVNAAAQASNEIYFSEGSVTIEKDKKTLVDDTPAPLSTAQISLSKITLKVPSNISITKLQQALASLAGFTGYQVSRSAAWQYTIYFNPQTFTQQFIQQHISQLSFTASVAATGDASSAYTLTLSKAVKLEQLVIPADANIYDTTRYNNTITINDIIGDLHQDTLYKNNIETHEYTVDEENPDNTKYILSRGIHTGEVANNTYNTTDKDLTINYTSNFMGYNLNIAGTHKTTANIKNDHTINIYAGNSKKYTIASKITSKKTYANINKILKGDDIQYAQTGQTISQAMAYSTTSLHTGYWIKMLNGFFMTEMHAAMYCRVRIAAVMNVTSGSGIGVSAVSLSNSTAAQMEAIRESYDDAGIDISTGQVNNRNVGQANVNNQRQGGVGQGDSYVDVNNNQQQNNQQAVNGDLVDPNDVFDQQLKQETVSQQELRNAQTQLDQQKTLKQRELQDAFNNYKNPPRVSNEDRLLFSVRELTAAERLNKIYTLRKELAIIKQQEKQVLDKRVENLSDNDFDNLISDNGPLNNLKSDRAFLGNRGRSLLSDLTLGLSERNTSLGQSEENKLGEYSTDQLKGILSNTNTEQAKKDLVELMKTEPLVANAVRAWFEQQDKEKAAAQAAAARPDDQGDGSDADVSDVSDADVSDVSDVSVNDISIKVPPSKIVTGSRKDPIQGDDSVSDADDSVSDADVSDDSVNDISIKVFVSNNIQGLNNIHKPQPNLLRRLLADKPRGGNGNGNGNQAEEQAAEAEAAQAAEAEAEANKKEAAQKIFTRINDFNNANTGNYKITALQGRFGNWTGTSPIIKIGNDANAFLNNIQQTNFTVEQIDKYVTDEAISNLKPDTINNALKQTNYSEQIEVQVIASRGYLLNTDQTFIIEVDKTYRAQQQEDSDQADQDGQADPDQAAAAEEAAKKAKAEEAAKKAQQEAEEEKARQEAAEKAKAKEIFNRIQDFNDNNADYKITALQGRFGNWTGTSPIIKIGNDANAFLNNIQQTNFTVEQIDKYVTDEAISNLKPDTINNALKQTEDEAQEIEVEVIASSGFLYDTKQTFIIEVKDEYLKQQKEAAEKDSKSGPGNQGDQGGNGGDNSGHFRGGNANQDDNANGGSDNDNDQDANQEAADKARKEAADKARKEAADKARKEAADKARKEAADKARKEAADKARKEADKEERPDDRQNDRQNDSDNGGPGNGNQNNNQGNVNQEESKAEAEVAPTMEEVALTAESSEKQTKDGRSERVIPQIGISQRGISQRGDKSNSLSSKIMSPVSSSTSPSFVEQIKFPGTSVEAFVKLQKEIKQYFKRMQQEASKGNSLSSIDGMTTHKDFEAFLKKDPKKTNEHFGKLLQVFLGKGLQFRDGRQFKDIDCRTEIMNQFKNKHTRDEAVNEFINLLEQFLSERANQNSSDCKNLFNSFKTYLKSKAQDKVNNLHTYLGDNQATESIARKPLQLLERVGLPDNQKLHDVFNINSGAYNLTITVASKQFSDWNKLHDNQDKNLTELITFKQLTNQHKTFAARKDDLFPAYKAFIDANDKNLAATKVANTLIELFKQGKDLQKPENKKRTQLLTTINEKINIALNNTEAVNDLKTELQGTNNATNIKQKLLDVIDLIKENDGQDKTEILKALYTGNKKSNFYKRLQLIDDTALNDNIAQAAYHAYAEDKKDILNKINQQQQAHNTVIPYDNMMDLIPQGTNLEKTMQLFSSLQTAGMSGLPHTGQLEVLADIKNYINSDDNKQGIEILQTTGFGKTVCLKLMAALSGKDVTIISPLESSGTRDGINYINLDLEQMRLAGTIHAKDPHGIDIFTPDDKNSINQQQLIDASGRFIVGYESKLEAERGTNQLLQLFSLYTPLAEKIKQSFVVNLKDGNHPDNAIVAYDESHITALDSRLQLQVNGNSITPLHRAIAMSATQPINIATPSQTAQLAQRTQTELDKLNNKIQTAQQEFNQNKQQVIKILNQRVTDIKQDIQQKQNLHLQGNTHFAKIPLATNKKLKSSITAKDLEKVTLAYKLLTIAEKKNIQNKQAVITKDEWEEIEKHNHYTENTNVQNELNLYKKYFDGRNKQTFSLFDRDPLKNAAQLLYQADLDKAQTVFQAIVKQQTKQQLINKKITDIKNINANDLAGANKILDKKDGDGNPVVTRIKEYNTLINQNPKTKGSFARLIHLTNKHNSMQDLHTELTSQANNAQQQLNAKLTATDEQQQAFTQATEILLGNDVYKKEDQQPFNATNNAAFIKTKIEEASKNRTQVILNNITNPEHTQDIATKLSQKMLNYQIVYRNAEGANVALTNNQDASIDNYTNLKNNFNGKKVIMLYDANNMQGGDYEALSRATTDQSGQLGADMAHLTFDNITNNTAMPYTGANMKQMFGRTRGVQPNNSGNVTRKFFSSKDANEITSQIAHNTANSEQITNQVVSVSGIQEAFQHQQNVVNPQYADNDIVKSLITLKDQLQLDQRFNNQANVTVTVTRETIQNTLLSQLKAINNNIAYNDKDAKYILKREFKLGNTAVKEIEGMKSNTVKQSQLVATVENYLIESCVNALVKKDISVVNNPPAQQRQHSQPANNPAAQQQYQQPARQQINTLFNAQPAQQQQYQQPARQQINTTVNNSPNRFLDNNGKSKYKTTANGTCGIVAAIVNLEQVQGLNNERKNKIFNLLQEQSGEPHKEVRLKTGNALNQALDALGVKNKLITHGEDLHQNLKETFTQIVENRAMGKTLSTETIEGVMRVLTGKDRLTVYATSENRGLTLLNISKDWQDAVRIDTLTPGIYIHQIGAHFVADKEDAIRRLQQLQTDKDGNEAYLLQPAQQQAQQINMRGTTGTAHTQQQLATLNKYTANQAATDIQQNTQNFLSKILLRKPTHNASNITKNTILQNGLNNLTNEQKQALQDALRTQKKGAADSIQGSQQRHTTQNSTQITQHNQILVNNTISGENKSLTKLADLSHLQTLRDGHKNAKRNATDIFTFAVDNNHAVSLQMEYNHENDTTKILVTDNQLYGNSNINQQVKTAIKNALGTDHITIQASTAQTNQTTQHKSWKDLGNCGLHSTLNNQNAYMRAITQSITAQKITENIIITETQINAANKVLNTELKDKKITREIVDGRKTDKYVVQDRLNSVADSGVINVAGDVDQLYANIETVLKNGGLATSQQIQYLYEAIGKLDAVKHKNLQETGIIADLDAAFINNFMQQLGSAAPTNANQTLQHLQPTQIELNNGDCGPAALVSAIRGSNNQGIQNVLNDLWITNNDTVQAAANKIRANIIAEMTRATNNSQLQNDNRTLSAIANNANHALQLRQAANTMDMILDQVAEDTNSNFAPNLEVANDNRLLVVRRQDALRALPRNEQIQVVNKYIRNMQQQGTWMTDTEMRIFANIHNININVHANIGGQYTHLPLQSPIDTYYGFNGTEYNTNTVPRLENGNINGSDVDINLSTNNRPTIDIYNHNNIHWTGFNRNLIQPQPQPQQQQTVNPNEISFDLDNQKQANTPNLDIDNHQFSINKNNFSDFIDKLKSQDDGMQIDSTGNKTIANFSQTKIKQALTAYGKTQDLKDPITVNVVPQSDNSPHQGQAIQITDKDGQSVLLYEQPKVTFVNNPNSTLVVPKDDPCIKQIEQLKKNNANQYEDVTITTNNDGITTIAGIEKVVNEELGK